MTAQLDALAAAAAPLQAWHGQAAWIPVFDRAEEMAMPRQGQDMSRGHDSRLSQGLITCNFMIATSRARVRPKYESASDRDRSTDPV